MYEANLKAAAEPATSPVNDALTGLSHSQAITESLIDQLTQRLGSILEPIIPTVGANGGGPVPCAPPDRSELQGAISSSSRRQTGLNEQLRALFSRLTV